MRRLLVASLTFLAIASVVTADDTRSRVTRLADWVTAIRAHEPGVADAPLARIAGWGNADINQLWLDAQTLFHFVHCSNTCGAPSVVGLDGRRHSANYSKQDISTLRVMAGTIRDRPGDHDELLKRAAILHADIVMLADPVGDALAPERAPVPGQRRSGGVAPAPERVVLKTTDGREQSLTYGMTHWEIAYALLDRVGDNGRSPGPGEDQTVRLWYRATIAHLQSIAMYDQRHYSRALRLFPTDPDILFQAGCLHEALASPPVQVALRTASVPPNFESGVKSDRSELENAERFFRQALAQNSRFVEARLRLGRVLGRLGRHADAAAELRQLSDGDFALPDNRYYAAMFLGAEEEALGRRDAAREAYTRARDLFPQAQSAHIALSHLAREAGDRGEALKAIQDVLDLPEQADDRLDPYWVYHFFPGRDLDRLLDRLYQPFRRGAAR